MHLNPARGIWKQMQNQLLPKYGISSANLRTGAISAQEEGYWKYISLTTFSSSSSPETGVSNHYIQYTKYQNRNCKQCCSQALSQRHIVDRGDSAGELRGRILLTSRLMGSPSQWITVSGATMQYGLGSVSTTLNSTARIPPRTKKMSPVKPCTSVVCCNRSLETSIPVLPAAPEDKGVGYTGVHCWHF